MISKKDVKTTLYAPENAGCPDPCIEGVAGFDDGPRLAATFDYPTGIALGPNQTVSRFRSVCDKSVLVLPV